MYMPLVTELKVGTLIYFPGFSDISKKLAQMWNEAPEKEKDVSLFQTFVFLHIQDLLQY